MTIFEYLDMATNAIKNNNCESFNGFCAMLDDANIDVDLAKQAWEEAMRQHKKNELRSVSIGASILCREYKKLVLEKGLISMKEFDDAIGAYGFMRTAEALKWKNGA